MERDPNPTPAGSPAWRAYDLAGGEAALYRVLAESASDVIGFHAADGTLLFVTPSVERFLGWSPSQVEGRAPSDLVHPEDLDAVRRAVQTLPSRSAQGEFRVRCSDGRFRWADGAARALVRGGELRGFVSILREVHSRIEAELRQRASQQAAVATLGELAMNAQDLEPLLQAACATVLDTLGVTGALLLERAADGGSLETRASAGIDPEGLLAVRLSTASLAGAALRHQGSMVTADARAEWPADAVLLAHDATSAAAAVLHGKDRATGVLLALSRGRRTFSADDVHFLEAVASTLAAALARRRAEREVLDRERQMRAVLDHALDATLLLDDAGVVVDVNGAACGLLGASRTALVGRRLGEVAPPLPGAAAASRRNALLAEFRATGQVSGEIEFQRTGETRTVEYHARARILPGRHLVVLRDVTERRQLQARLALADRMVSVGTLAAGVAHELNNPLAYVDANLAFLADRLAALARGGDRPVGAALADVLQRLDEAVRDARDGAERMRVIVRDLRTFSRGDEAQEGPVDLVPVLESCLHMAWNEIRHRARLEKDLAPVPPVRGNEARLGQVFLNLLVNAAQSIPEGHSDANVIRVAARAASDGRVLVELRDTGCGIAPENLRRIFDPFFTTKSIGVGTGLGLSICHSIVAALGGEIEVDSAVGRGSTFRVLLPPAPPAFLEPAPTPARPATRPRGRILVVDDEPLVGTVIERILQADHDVVVVTSARAALARLERGERFDVVLSDLLMPEMSGMDLYREIVHRDPTLARRMVFLTGGAFTPAAHDFLESESVTCVEKPFQLETIRKVLAQKLAEPT